MNNPFKNFAMIPGLQVFVNDAACIIPEYRQIKFPKSKKKRIRKKWSKRSCNFGMKDKHHILHVGGKCYVSSKIMEKLKKYGNE